MAMRYFAHVVHAYTYLQLLTTSYSYMLVFHVKALTFSHANILSIVLTSHLILPGLQSRAYTVRAFHQSA